MTVVLLNGSRVSSGFFVDPREQVVEVEPTSTLMDHLLSLKCGTRALCPALTQKRVIGSVFTLSVPNVHVVGTTAIALPLFFLSSLIGVVRVSDDNSSGGDISSPITATIFLDLIDQAHSHEAGREQFNSFLMHAREQFLSVFIDETDVCKVNRQCCFSRRAFLPALVQFIHAWSGKFAFKEEPCC